MITKAEARELHDYYDQVVKKLMAAKIALVEGGVQSYTIDDRSLTRFDLNKLESEIDNAIKKRAQYAAIMNGKSARKAVGVIPRDF